MHHLHRVFQLADGDAIEVQLNNAANVQLMTPEEYENYRNGRQFRYYGGYVRSFPIRIAAPHAGEWHLVVDLGGGAGMVTGATAVISRAYAGSDLSVKT